MTTSGRNGSSDAPREDARRPPRGIGWESAEDLRLADCALAVYRHRWVCMAVIVCSVSVAVAYNWSATPLYESRATLLIDAEPNVVSFRQVIEHDQGKPDYYQTHYEMLRSRSLARRTIDALDLWNHPELGGTPPVSAQGRTEPASAESLAGETAAQTRRVGAFLSRRTIVPIRNSRLVEVKFRAADPELAAAAADGLANAFIEQNLEFRLLATREATDWLREQITAQRQQVQASEESLQRYREQQDAVSLEDRQNIVVQKLAQLNAALTSARTDRMEKEARYNQLREVQHDRAALDAFPAILSNAFINGLKSELAALQRRRAQLSEQLGDLHPEMVQLQAAIATVESRLQGEFDKVVQAVGTDYRTALAHERALMAALEGQKREVLELNRKAIDYTGLQRDAASNRQMFETLLQRIQEAGISEELHTSSIRIVDPAEVPRRPVWPRTRLNLLVALLTGMFVAGVAVVGFEKLDPRIKSPSHVTDGLGLAFLGIAPQVHGLKSGGELLVGSGARPDFAEAIRALRASVVFSPVTRAARSLLVTSTYPGEGKTLIASNLAASLASAGQRVLLVDGDLRRPRLHRVFNVKAQPGLAELLAGQVRASAAIQRTAIQNLWVLAAGTITTNPADLLGNDRFRKLLGGLGEPFDWVLVDSPPVLAVADTCLIAHAASAVVFVVGARRTSLRVTQAALERIESVQGRLVGAVLNRADLKRHAEYYYPYYRREDSAYYWQSPAPASGSSNPRGDVVATAAAERS